jgi:hypothetical protein
MDRGICMQKKMINLGVFFIVLGIGLIFAAIFS